MRIRRVLWAVFAAAAMMLACDSAAAALPGAAAGFAPRRAAAIVIFAATYLVMAVGKLPGFTLDRAGAALLGASLMVAVGVLTLGQALRAIDWATLALLLGMMIVVGNLRLSGFFRLVNNWVTTRARHPLLLLLAVVATSGLFSAFLVNDAICLVLTPLVLDLVARLKRNPVPYLLAIAMASNIGSTATITGNPQNILIGGFSKIPYIAFAAHLVPVAAVGLVLAFVLIALLYPREFWTRERLRGTPVPAHAHRPLVVKSVLIALALIAGFFTGQPPAKLAIIAGGISLLTRAVKSRKIYGEIDWPLLLMFAGLFAVVAGFEKVALSPGLVAGLSRGRLDHTAGLSIVTAVLANLVSNVPAVLILQPFVARLADPPHAWLVVAMASTLAGNLTLLGSVANLIVVQWARVRGVTVGFWEYFRVGAPLTVLTILFGVWWL
ncbi:MAG: anion transporter [Stellaceae bacterium]